MINLYELIYCFVLLHNHECLNEMKIKGKGTVPRKIQSPKHPNAEHADATRQSGNRIKDK